MKTSEVIKAQYPPLAYHGMRLSKQIRKRYWLSVLSKHDAVCIRTADGQTLRSPSKNVSARNTYIHGVKDPRVFCWMARNIREGSTVIDVGANVGAYTLRLSKIVRPLGKVIAVEPTSTNLEFLRENVCANNLHNVYIEGVALGAECGEIEMSYASENAGEHHVASGCDGAAEREVVKVMRLDDLVRKHGSPNIAFVKIDVEGFEHNVLLGFEETLCRQSPVLLIEHSEEAESRYGYRRESTIQFLQSLGYEAYSLRKHGIQAYNWERGGGDALWSKTPLAS